MILQIKDYQAIMVCGAPHAFATIEGKPFEVTKVEKKEGKEQPPQLYDLTSLQVDCNRKFGYSAEMTLNLIQALYERKFTTYPRVDTQYLSDDIYPKCPQTLNGLYQTKFGGVAVYAEYIKPIGGKPLKKTKRVFDSSRACSILARTSGASRMASVSPTFT